MMRLRGTWVPLLPGIWRTITAAVIPILAIGVGIDYLTGSKTSTWSPFSHPASESSVALSGVEDALPLAAWGWMLVSNGLVVIVGYVLRRRLLTIWGLVWVAALMTTIGIGIGWTTLPLTDTFRSALMHITFRSALMHIGVGLFAGAAAIGYALQPKAGGTGGPE